MITRVPMMFPPFAGLALAMALVLGLSGCTPARGPAAITAPAARAGAGPVAAAQDQGRHAVSYLFLSAEGPAPGLPARAGSFLFSGLDAGRISIELGSISPSRLLFDLTCDGPARITGRASGQDDPTAIGWSPAGTLLAGQLGPNERLRSRIELDPATGACTLRVGPRGREGGHRLELRREEQARPELATLDSPPGACRVPRLPAGDRLAAVFHAERPLSQTCPQRPGRTALMADGFAALNAKIEALTGRPLPEEVLRQGNPEVALDYTHAPQLDLIYVSYLNLNADFTGYLMARMLAHHAARGTVVRILIADPMLTGVDRRLIETLAARFPNVQFQPFRLPHGVDPGIDGELARIHRVTHVKLFATVARQPGRSLAMVGGRNLHDGYTFPEVLDLSRWPFLQQYDPAATRLAGGVALYVDFEIALHDDQAVRAIVRQMAGFWHRDHDSQQPLRPPAVRPGPAAGAVPAAGPRMRHFISIPYADEAAQEVLFVDLIDAAERRIDISSPYINLTPALQAAFERARARGVEVHIVTTIRVREATDFLATALNRMFAIDHADWLNFIDYDPYPLLLHSKLLVFDRRLAVVTSTNLNRRSFLHDTENGVVILDPDTARAIGQVIDGYAALGVRVSPAQQILGLARTLLRWRALRDAF